MAEFGYLEGETCNRNGCNGIIEQYSSDSSCSCHINPPCSYCVDDRHYCPECDWHGKDDQTAAASNSYTANTEWIQALQKRNDEFNAKWQGKVPITKLDYQREEHTHFTMKVRGVYPDGMSREDVYEKVKGSFGGRFEFFDNNKFKFIAYTD